MLGIPKLRQSRHDAQKVEFRSESFVRACEKYPSRRLSQVFVLGKYSNWLVMTVCGRMSLQFDRRLWVYSQTFRLCRAVMLGTWQQQSIDLDALSMI
jgi:hypothetical protein